MTTQQTVFVKKRDITEPRQAGVTVTKFYTHTFDPAGLLAADVMEFCGIPAHGRVVDLIVTPENIATVTWKVGWMTGDYGDATTVRTVGSEFLAAAAAATQTPVPMATLAALAALGSAPKSIGVQVSADFAAGSTKRLNMRVAYIVGD